MTGDRRIVRWKASVLGGPSDHHVLLAWIMADHAASISRVREK